MGLSNKEKLFGLSAAAVLAVACGGETQKDAADATDSTPDQKFCDQYGLPEEE